MTKLNKIHGDKGDEIKEVSAASNDAVSTVTKDAAVVGVLNKITESKLIKDLTKVAEAQGGEASIIISAAEAPVKLDASKLVQPYANKPAQEGSGLFGGIASMANGFGDFGKLGFEKFGVVSLNADDHALLDLGAKDDEDEH